MPVFIDNEALTVWTYIMDSIVYGLDCSGFTILDLDRIACILWRRRGANVINGASLEAGRSLLQDLLLAI